MVRKLNAKFLAGAMALGLAAIPLPPDAVKAQPQLSIQVGFNDFYGALAPYGRWFHHPRWGDVWMPASEAGFRPYRNGHWDYTDQYGWVWASDYVWGDIPFHYGRWVFDPNSGWLWIPGYVWAPAWVLWRYGDGNVGWFPMPPDSAFLAGAEIYPTAWTDADRAYGYLDWYGPNYGPNWFAGEWTFVGAAHFADRDYSRYAVTGAQAAGYFRQTRDITRYSTANNFVVNRSVDPAIIGKARGRAVAPIPLRQAIRANAPVVPVNIGREVQQTEHQAHGGNPQAPANGRAVPLTSAAAGRGNERNAVVPGPAGAPGGATRNRQVAQPSPGPAGNPGAVSGPPGRPQGTIRNRQVAQPGPGPAGTPVAAGPGARQREAIVPPQGQPIQPGRERGGPQQGLAGTPPGFAGPPQGAGPGRQRGGPQQGLAGTPPGFAGPPQGAGPGGGQQRGPGRERGGPVQGLAGPPPGFARPPQGFAGPPQGTGPGGPAPQVALGPGSRRGGGPGGPPAGFAPPAGGQPQGVAAGGPPGRGGPPGGGGPPAAAQKGGGGQPGNGKEHKG